MTPSRRASAQHRRATAGICRLRTALDNWAEALPPSDSSREPCTEAANPYSRLMPLLVKGFKELTERCENLEAAVHRLDVKMPQRSV